MDAVLFIFIACLFIGAIVGLLAGMLGIGGGLIIVPALLYLLPHFLHIDVSLAMPMAIATSLSTIILTGFSSAQAHFKLGNLQSRIITRSLVGIIIGAGLGAQLVSILPGEQVKTVFAYLVMIIAAQMIFGGTKKSEQQISSWLLVVIGLITGTVSSFMGIGGGAILVPALVWFRVDIRHAIGCAAFCGLMIAFFGTGSFIHAGWQLDALPQWSIGYVYLPAALGIVITSVFTARIGAKISQNLNTQRLKRILAGLLVLVSLRMLLG